MNGDDDHCTRHTIEVRIQEKYSVETNKHTLSHWTGDTSDTSRVDLLLEVIKKNSLLSVSSPRDS